MTSNVDTLRHPVMSPNTGSSLHRENGGENDVRENKNGNFAKTQGILPKHREFPPKHSGFVCLCPRFPDFKDQGFFYIDRNFFFLTEFT